MSPRDVHASDSNNDKDCSILTQVYWYRVYILLATITASQRSFIDSRYLLLKQQLKSGLHVYCVTHTTYVDLLVLAVIEF